MFSMVFIYTGLVASISESMLRFVTKVDVPGFFVASGLFASPEDKAAAPRLIALIKKILRLMVPYGVCGFIACVASRYGSPLAARNPEVNRKSDTGG